MAERVLLVIVDFQDRNEKWAIEDIAIEMSELVKACEATVVDTIFCRTDSPSAKTLINKGKVEEIAAAIPINKIDTVVFSCDLKGGQQRNLEKEFGSVKTIDRTQLILDIFVRRASSMEGKMQVELAQLEYLLPRLVGKGIELSRLGGGIGTLGPGETKLEVDRRRIGRRITKLKRDLKDVTAARKVKRKKRQSQQIPSISLVGYTNAGKSTLLNTLTEAETQTRDGLFTTLDSLSRQHHLPNNQKVVFSDTVGFMHDLPHHLIEAFKATLEEVQDADLLLHVIDISHYNHRNYYDAVNGVLKELDCLDKPTITVLNKIDQLDDPSWLKKMVKEFEPAVAISALKKENLGDLFEAVMEVLSKMIVEVNVKLRLDQMDLVNLAHKEGQVHSIQYAEDGIYLRATLPTRLSGKFT